MQGQQKKISRSKGKIADEGSHSLPRLRGRVGRGQQANALSRTQRRGAEELRSRRNISQSRRARREANEGQDLILTRVGCQRRGGRGLFIDLRFGCFVRDDAFAYRPLPVNGGANLYLSNSSPLKSLDISTEADDAETRIL